MTIHPTEANYPTSLIGAGGALTGNADPSSSFLLPETTYAGTAAPELFSYMAGEPMEISSKAEVVSPLEVLPILSASGYPPSLIRVGGPLTGNADPSSSFLLPGAAYVVLATIEPFSSGVTEEITQASCEETVVSPLEVLPILSASGYPPSLIRVGGPLTGNADPSSSFLLPGAAYVVLATIEPFSSGVTEEITQASCEETVVSPLEPSPLLKLLAQLTTLQYTPEDERWPGAIWPDARAFADAQTFLCRLPLNVIPLPDISLADDGEVNFLWQSDDAYVDLGFYGTGTCSYFARGQDGRRIYGDDAPASEGLPPEITILFAT